MSGHSHDASRKGCQAKYHGPERRWLERRPLLELLEPRQLMAADLSSDPDVLPVLSSGACQCPICTGALQNITTVQSTTTIAAAGSPLTAIPQLSSNASARAKLYLDFNGNFESRWGSYTNVTTKVYDIDGDATTFSAQELANIREIWARVSEDYAPFNIDVTTIDPGANVDKVVARLAIGGNYSDWFGSSAGGVAYVGGFSNSASNTGYVFSDALGKGNARYVAEAASHEAGHLFGLSHQATWNGNTLVSGYSQGDANWAPIMGVGYYSARTTWYNGPTDNAPTDLQDDISILVGASNGFGLKADDYGGTFQTGVWRGATGGSITYAGLIGSSDDQDFALFNTGAGQVTFRVDVAQYGANLDAILEIRDSSGTVVASANPTTTFGATITTTLAQGTYALVVRSSGGYGNMGQYTVTGTAIPITSIPGGGGGGGGGTTTAPEIDLFVGSTALASGGTVNFGNVVVGQSITQTITIKNTGTAALTLSPISASTLPAGYSIVTNVGVASLAAGQSTTLVLKLAPTAAGTFAGTIVLSNSDASEAAYQIRLSGTATVPQVVTRTMDDGSAGTSTTGSWQIRTGVGREGDVRVARNSGPTSVATYDFTGLTSGTYRVLANWTGGREFATNTPITLSDGGRYGATVRVNQRVASGGVNVDGTNWTVLGNVVVQGGRLIVRYANNGVNGSVMADAIRIERIAATTTARGMTIEDAPSTNSYAGQAITASSGTTMVGGNFNGGTAAARPALLPQAPSSANLFQDTHDFAVESNILEETLTLLSASRKAAQPSDNSFSLAGRTSSHDDLFANESDWLSPR
ncbi:MAG: choice-of-anchor D domain-containing protein [Pirellulales bacterium]